MTIPRPFKPRILVILSIALALLLPEISFANDCTSSDIILADQGDVNLFQQAFSGGGTCDTITGTLRIEDGDGTDITDLTPLRALRYVNGDLVVYDNNELKSLEGLEGIQRVGGNVEIRYNNELGDCSALYELLDASVTTRTGVAGDVYIDSNAAGCNSLTEVVDAVKYGLVACPVYEYDPFGNGIPWYQIRNQSDVSELEEITGGNCNWLAGILWIGIDPATSYIGDIRDLSELSWIRNISGLAIIVTPYLKSLEGLHNLAGGFGIIEVLLAPIESLAPLSGLTDHRNSFPQVYENTGVSIQGTNIETLEPLKGIRSHSPGYTWWVSGNGWLSTCEWADGAEPTNFAAIGDNAPGCNSYDEIITYWGEPRYNLTLTASPGGRLEYGQVSGTNTSDLRGGSFISTNRPSVSVPKGLNYTFSPSPNNPYEFSEFLSDCNGGPRSSTQEFILSSMEDDCYLHVNYSRGPTDPSNVAAARTLSGSSCKVVQPALEPKVEWREKGLLNVSDQAVEVICPLPRKSYLGRDQQYFSDNTAVAIDFSVDAVSSAHTDCTLVAGESVGDFVAPATRNFRLHGWATDSGEITIRPDAYPTPSKADVLSYHAVKCTLQPGVGISSLKIDALK